MWWLGKPDYGPRRWGPNSNEVNKQAQWAHLAQATQQVSFVNLQPRYPGVFKGADHDGALGSRLSVTDKAMEHQSWIDSCL
jgi:hypothetical protein